ncbi:leucine--tRNA ligase, cytoplasmic-like isoform X2 [Argentina anserina]|uniref:leucine--tRNA ligase, cytoplasmic-like isoform X2 n=1 Tax=Argentina anserina TaxID=57926 RepID=UPI00217642EE|nr:leucine--tRNA ligase, cytoplasmic-like isoform X2 [Potentilla anserina]
MDRSKPALRKLATEGENILLEIKILLEIEAEVREWWEEKGVFVHAHQSPDNPHYPSDDELGDDRKKWFENYLFGGLSRRAFLISKLECCSAYHRLRNDDVPWNVKSSGADELPEKIIHLLIGEPPVFPTVWRAAYSTDAMRLSLACSCDGGDSPRILFNTANSAIRKLTKEMSWISEQLAYMAAAADSSSFVRRIRRDGPPSTFADKVFANEIDIAVHNSDHYYQACMFQEALIAGFLQLQAARDWYRVSCGPCGMNHDLVLRYIDVHTRLIAPICPHYSEYVWREYLKQEGFVVTNSGWPAADAPDLILQSANKYLQDLIEFMRELETKFQELDDGIYDATEEEKKAVGLIYVKEEVDGWEAKCLRILQDNFDTETKTFSAPDEDMLDGLISYIYGDFTIRQDIDYRQTEQLCTSFLKLKKEEAVNFGADALELKLPFGEIEVLQENLDLIKREIGLHAVKVQAYSGTNGLEDFTLDSPPSPGRPAAALVSRDFYEKMERTAPGVWEFKRHQFSDKVLTPTSRPPSELLYQQKKKHPFKLFQEKMEHSDLREPKPNDDQLPDKILAPLYHPPYELLFQGSFKKAKRTASVEDKWLLIWLHSWCLYTANLRRLIKTPGLMKLSQKSSALILSSGRKICTYYNLVYTPVVLIIDPISGENMRSWYGMVQPECLLKDLLVQFLENSPKDHHHPGEESSQPQLEESDDDSVGDKIDEEDEELQWALVASLKA